MGKSGGIDPASRLFYQGGLQGLTEPLHQHLKFCHVRKSCVFSEKGYLKRLPL